MDPSWLRQVPKDVSLSIDSGQTGQRHLRFSRRGFDPAAGCRRCHLCWRQQSGKVYRLQTQRAQSGTFESKTLDAKTVASWGKISWHIANPGGASIELSTRTGNTEKADSSWSDWSAAYAASGTADNQSRERAICSGGHLSKAVPVLLEAPRPNMLDQVQIAYLQQNLRPQVTSIDVLPYGVELQKQPSLAASGLGLITPVTLRMDAR